MGSRGLVTQARGHLDTRGGLVGKVGGGTVRTAPLRLDAHARPPDRRPMLAPLARALLRSPIGPPARRLYRWLRPLSIDEQNARYDHETGEVIARALGPSSSVPQRLALGLTIPSSLL